MKDLPRSRFKRPLRPLVELLLTSPTMSNARLARLCRCEARRVSRYRRAIERHTIPPHQLLDCDEATLQALLKQRQPSRVEAQPDFDLLAVELPNASAFVQWRHYRDGAIAEGQQTLSYSGFNRARRAHFTRARVVETLHPRKPLPRGANHPSAPFRMETASPTMRLLGEVDAFVSAPLDVLIARRPRFDMTGAMHV